LSSVPTVSRINMRSKATLDHTPKKLALSSGGSQGRVATCVAPENSRTSNCESTQVATLQPSTATPGAVGSRKSKPAAYTGAANCASMPSLTTPPTSPAPSLMAISLPGSRLEKSTTNQRGAWKVTLPMVSTPYGPLATGKAPVALALVVATRKLVRSPNVLVLAAAGKASTAERASIAAAATGAVRWRVRRDVCDMVGALFERCRAGDPGLRRMVRHGGSRSPTIAWCLPPT
jgi:hypothetical protein